MCSSTVFEYISTSFRYNNTPKSNNSKNMVFIMRWNVAGAVERPNGITVNWNVPYLQVNEVLTLSSNFIGI